ncbi:hypothetical protein [Sphingomonas sp.]|uniref:hypothetical protein n=1 Tax=Sphingomonas sp. TaxID=28214 RepID=UPI003D6D3DCA
MTAATAAAPRSIGRSVLAIVAGLAFSVLLALGIDMILHALQVFPPWDQPMTETSDAALAFSYRAVIAIGSGYLAARLAPSAPMKHAIILGMIGMTLATLGLIGAVTMKMGPLWYPAALVITALPLAWIGGALAHRRA